MDQDRRKVVGHYVNALKLLHELSSRTKKEASESLRRTGLALEYVSPSDCVFSFILDAVFDLPSLGNDEHALFSLVFNRCQNLSGLVITTMLDKPTVSS